MNSNRDIQRMKTIFIRVLAAIGIALCCTVSFEVSAQPLPTWVRSLAWSPDGSKIATGSQDGTIHIWNAQTGGLLQILRRGGPGPVLSVVWHPQSRKLASGGLDQPIVIWDATAGQTLDTFQEPLPRYTALAWSPDGTKIASVNDVEAFRIWNAATGQLLSKMRSIDLLHSVAWSPNGAKIAVGASHRIKIWSPGGQHLATLQDDGLEVTSLAWSSDNIRVASANVDGVVHIWNTSTNQIVRTFIGHTEIVDSVAWSPDETKLASASIDKTVRIWDVVTGQPINTIRNNGRVFTVAWSPDGSKIACGTSNGGIQIVSPIPRSTATP
jgi:WD40 repeat protein